MRLGTWTTIDCPTDKQTEALAWLQVEFGKIGGEVWLKENAHDLGSYPSFEVDMPEELEDIEDLTDDEELNEQKDKWVEQANDIEDRYYKKYSDYL
jgi:hypothetical protein